MNRPAAASAAMRLLALVAVGLALATFRREPDAPVTFLLDLGHWGPEGPPVGVIERRAYPVLAAPETRGAASVTTTVPASLTLDLPLDPTAVTPSEGVELEALLLLQPENRRVVPEWHAGPTPTAHLQFTSREAGAEVHVIALATRLPPPGRSVSILGPARVQPDALLVLAYGVEPSRCRDHPVVRLGVDVLDGRHSRPLLRRRLDPQRECDRWIGARYPLDEYVGRGVRFRFWTRVVDPRDRDKRLFVYWADPRLVASRRGRPAPPNLVLVSLDTLGARHLSAYGYPYPTSPRLAELAAGNVLFERAVSHYPSTTGSHMTLLTGRLPMAHDVRHFFGRLAPGIPTLPELLRRAGYVTAATTEDANIVRTAGFGRGFHVYWESAAAPGAPGIAQAVRWLRLRPPEPFFLFIHTYEVHEPYTPRPRQLPLVRPGEAPDPADRVTRYDAEVRFVDEVVGSLLDLLKGQGQLARTVVVITGDHGEAFDEHGHRGHGSMLYDEVMHVPLLFLGAQMPPGLRIPDRVGLADVAPTLLDLAGVPVPAGLGGRSLVPLLRGREMAARPQVAELRGNMAHPDAPEPNLRAVWLGDQKVIRDLAHDRWEVFDLGADPDEKTNLAEADPAAIDSARPILAWYDALKHAAAGLPVITTESVDRLRALGYVE